MAEDGEGKQEPPEDDGHRGLENAVMLGFFLVLVAAGIWLLATMADARKAQDCAAQRRRNCATIAAPVRYEQTGRRENQHANNNPLDSTGGPDQRSGRVRARILVRSEECGWKRKRK